eukprot:TRINITY_DN2346_c0_g3_i1.p1 TRINITY_DN2346_c0_g3~~TRINITY_DN2346_c0_g3_i1.p1  ORF type:complete len:118 (+),score=19.74 TRINITY_DN2346_c0_g3_i1:53-355(+)
MASSSSSSSSPFLHEIIFAINKALQLMLLKFEISFFSFEEDALIFTAPYLRDLTCLFELQRNDITEYMAKTAIMKKKTVTVVEDAEMGPAARPGMCLAMD